MKITINKEIASRGESLLSGGGDRPALLDHDGGYRLRLVEYSPVSEVTTSRGTSQKANFKFAVADGEEAGKTIYHTLWLTAREDGKGKPVEEVVLSMIGSADRARFAQLCQSGASFDVDEEFQRLVGNTFHANVEAYVDSKSDRGVQVLTRCKNFCKEDSLKPKVSYTDITVTATIQQLAALKTSGAPSNGASAASVTQAAAPDISKFLQ